MPIAAACTARFAFHFVIGSSGSTDGFHFGLGALKRYVQLLPTTGEFIEIGAINEQYAKELASINGTTIVGWFD